MVVIWGRIIFILIIFFLFAKVIVLFLLALIRVMDVWGRVSCCIVKFVVVVVVIILCDFVWLWDLAVIDVCLLIITFRCCDVNYYLLPLLMKSCYPNLIIVIFICINIYIASSSFYYSFVLIIHHHNDFDKNQPYYVYYHANNSISTCAYK